MSTLLLDRPALATEADVLLLHAFARRGRPLCVTDLVRVMTGTGRRLSDVVEALAGELAAGRIGRWGYRRDDDGQLTGALLYDLTDDGWQAVHADRAAA